MAPPFFCYQTSCHVLPTCNLVPPSAVPRSRPTSVSPLVQRVVIPSGNPRRTVLSPLLAAAAQRPRSDRVSAERVPTLAEQSSDGVKEIDEGKGAKAGSPGERKHSSLTAEKARVLRREMRATEIWHDAMYHSAIASRLASPDEH